LHYCAHTHYTHGIIVHMISHGLTTFHAKRDSMRTYEFFDSGALL